MRAWRLLVPFIALGAGLLFAASARTANGTDLRSARTGELQQLIAARNVEVRRSTAALAGLRKAVDAQTRAAARENAPVQTAKNQAAALDPVVGLTALRGPALTVTLDDAPRSADGSLPLGATPDDLVVHQQDVQAVVNALWAGGAEAMTLMGQRVVATSAVRCVGNTLLLQGRVYSPPFTVTAIGDVAGMRQALSDEQGVQLFRDYAAAYGLRYDVQQQASVRLPGYDGALSLDLARGGGS